MLSCRAAKILKKLVHLVLCHVLKINETGMLKIFAPCSG
jgi:hypothetical protein